MQTPFANDRRITARAGDSFYFNVFSKNMGDPQSAVAFDIDSGCLILHKKIRLRDVIGDDPANSHGVAELGFVGSEMAHLLYGGKHGKARRLRCGPSWHCDGQKEDQKDRHSTVRHSTHENRTTIDQE